MKAFLDERQRGHDPKHFMARGKVVPSSEQPERIDVLHKGAEAAGCHFEAPQDFGLEPIAAIHSADYLLFLQTIHERWRQLEGSSEEVIPNVHPVRRSANYPRAPVGQAGYYQADTACPIAAGTWEAAYWSAQTALSAAALVANGERAAYALCRPPGHHAFSDLAGGFCFLNNSAIAAQWFLQRGRRPAILDVDVHHGNGTQGIFYHRDDVLTVSLHADPLEFYPFFWGYAEERGAGAGLGCNLNLPLELGSGDDEFLAALTSATAAVEAFGADVLLVGLGLDAYEHDPLRGLAVTTPGFGRIGAALRAVDLPTIFLQEGGYLSNHLGNNLTEVLGGFER